MPKFTQRYRCANTIDSGTNNGHSFFHRELAVSPSRLVLHDSRSQQMGAWILVHRDYKLTEVATFKHKFERLRIGMNAL